MPYSTAPNVHYQNGFKGWTMLRKDGKGMTVKHEDVGLLAQRVHDELVQLKDGPFVDSPLPPSQAIAQLCMEISDGPLHIDKYTNITEYVAAINALSNPQTSNHACANGQTPDELRDAMAQLFDERDSMRSTITALQEEVARLARHVDVLDMRSRTVPAHSPA